MISDYSAHDNLLSRYLDGTINADELAELESRLVADEKFAEHFSRWCLLHQQISEIFTESALHEIMDQFVKGSPGLPKRALSHLASNSHKPPDTPTTLAFTRHPAARPGVLGLPWLFRHWAILGAAAAIILVAAWMVQHRSGTWLSGVPSSHDVENADLVATLTQVVDGVWAPRATVFHAGQLLRKGSRIELQSGMVKVTFECGAEVVLQGPCDFVAESQMVGFLNAGKITANVPHRAFSFAIRSPEVDFVDLGTAFGVSIGSNGKTQLHVFEGEVLCSQPKKEPTERNEVIHVTADKAMEFDSPGGVPSDIALDKKQFAKLISVRHAIEAPPKLLVSSRLALWLAADVGHDDRRQAARCCLA